MPGLKDLGWTFDTVSEKYEKMRPGYVSALYQAIFDYISIGEQSRVLEIGSGAGQATEPILKTGCELTAVEYGPHFSQLLTEKFKQYPRFSVVTGKFEDTFLEENAYDMVFSASAFHWIPEKLGYEKVFSILKKGGIFARFANHPYRNKDNPALADRIDEIYDEYYYTYHGGRKKPLVEYTEADAKERAMIALEYGFCDIKHALFHRQRSFTAEEYVQLLGTYSDHIAIEENIRKEFFSKIEEAINYHGGVMTLFDTIDLQLARK